jgi:hypothetical protein
MEHNSRIELYNNFYKYKDSTNKKYSLHKTKLLGEGVQGKVFQFCTNSNKICIAVKKMYINKKISKYIKKLYTPSALSHEQFIELAANQLTNQLVLQKISPHFPLNYTFEFKKRTGVCDESYPYKSYYYNEFISNSKTLNEWLRTNRTNALWYNAFFQITTAIYALQKYFNMYHLDLHTYNILVKKIKKGGYWTYNINNKIYKLPNLGYQFYIADFGVAWIPNKIIPWLISDEYIKKKSIYIGYDVYYIFDAILISKEDIPIKFKKDIQHLIKELKNNIPFDKAIEHTWFDMYNTIDKKFKHKLDEYNLNIRLNKSELPIPLKQLVKY